jgi:hypothetical protein
VLPREKLRTGKERGSAVGQANPKRVSKCESKVTITKVENEFIETIVEATSKGDGLKNDFSSTVE